MIFRMVLSWSLILSGIPTATAQSQNTLASQSNNSLLKPILNNWVSDLKLTQQPVSLQRLYFSAQSAVPANKKDAWDKYILNTSGAVIPAAQVSSEKTDGGYVFTFIFNQKIDGKQPTLKIFENSRNPNDSYAELNGYKLTVKDFAGNRGYAFLKRIIENRPQRDVASLTQPERRERPKTPQVFLSAKTVAGLTDEEFVNYMFLSQRLVMQIEKTQQAFRESETISRSKKAKKVSSYSFIKSAFADGLEEDFPPRPVEVGRVIGSDVGEPQPAKGSVGKACVFGGYSVPSGVQNVNGWVHCSVQQARGVARGSCGSDSFPCNPDVFGAPSAGKSICVTGAETRGQSSAGVKDYMKTSEVCRSKVDLNDASWMKSTRDHLGTSSDPQTIKRLNENLASVKATCAAYEAQGLAGQRSLEGDQAATCVALKAYEQDLQAALARLCAQAKHKDDPACGGKGAAPKPSMGIHPLIPIGIFALIAFLLIRKNRRSKSTPPIDPVDPVDPVDPIEPVEPEEPREPVDPDPPVPQEEVINTDNSGRPTPIFAPATGATL